MIKNQGLSRPVNRGRRGLLASAAIGAAVLLPVAAALPAHAVVGGSAATRGQFAPIVSIQRGSAQHSCTGTLIAANRVLTAASCADGTTAAALKVVTGRHHLSGTTPNQQTVEVAQIVKHSGYQAPTHANDIAILKLKNSVTLDGTYVAVADLPTSAAGRPTGNVTVAGWGATREGGPVSDSLQWAQIPTVTDAQCKTAYGTTAIYAGMICTGDYVTGGKGDCTLDAGGPVFKGRTLVGVYSWARGCGRFLSPGVNSGVSFYRNWIDANIG
ncbi:serine protease [Kitasatospora purpeofusca]|uniref:serine protease n=1 Tax=Kitasatospora purpeofusca TaxID=67352 RepID=UPI0022576F41|nr:serine protease [Kitasatospora purpeofusca]MCX4690269.1 serine protease [Kitasatospora purpeofusca]